MKILFNPKTNIIWAHYGGREDAVELDEAIAPIIQELNRKGYRTEYCCSGHPFGGLHSCCVTTEADELEWRSSWCEYLQKMYGRWLKSRARSFCDGKASPREELAPNFQEFLQKVLNTDLRGSERPFAPLCEDYSVIEISGCEYISSCCEWLRQVICEAKQVSEEAEEEQSNQDCFPYRIVDRWPEVDFYISFEEIMEEVIPTPLPDGFLWDEVTENDKRQAVRYVFSKFYYPDEETYEFLEERLNACKALYQWAKSLPYRQQVQED